MMKRGFKFIVLLFAFFFILSMPFSYSVSNVALDSASILYVGGSGVNNYDSIQDAIEAASEGDEIFVYNGVYNENLLIDKPLILTGEDKYDTIIDGKGEGNIVEIISDQVTIKNISIQNSGINLENESIIFAGCKILSNNISILNSIFEDCYIAIIFLNSSDNLIQNCFFNNNAGGINLFNTSYSIIENCSLKNQFRLWGFSFQRSDNNLIQFCNVSNNIDFGLAMTQSDDNRIINNVFWENNNGVLVAATEFEPCKNNFFYSNNFINSIILNARDYCINEFWDDGLIGNYWSDFDEPIEGAWDNDSNGIIDQTYNIIPDYIGNSDNYPVSDPIPIFEDIIIVDNIAPFISNPMPENNNISVLISQTNLLVEIDDNEGDLINWTIETSPDIGSASGSYESDGIKKCDLSDLEYDTTYLWYVNASDVDGSGRTESKVFVFTTERSEENGDDTPGFGFIILFLSFIGLLFFVKFGKKL